jgi:hypothetical protein
VPSEAVPGQCERCETPIKSGACNLVTWFEEGGTAEEQYDDEPRVLLDAEIEGVWDYDHWNWKFRRVGQVMRHEPECVEPIRLFRMTPDGEVCLTCEAIGAAEERGYERGRIEITDEDRQNINLFRKQGADAEKERILDGVLTYFAVAPKAAAPIVRIIEGGQASE